ncbi:MAG: hypothetical protein SOZ77_03990 [Candidatus Limousia pullorum]|nr:hypothetical protein [Candidatus Limousia pullorum]
MLSSSEGSGGDFTASPLSTYTKIFDELFPHYLSIGMTEEQYWDRDSTLVVAYRKAEELRISRKNNEMWLQGAYIYDALCRVSPVLNAFAKKGTKPVPYLSEAYALNDKQAEIKDEKKAKSAFNNGKRLMEGFMLKHNKKIEGK